MADYDIQIKGGTIVDGTRVPRYRGDVWIRDGKVAQLGGRAPGFAKKVIDADGLIVAPGFVDLHTHYDAQIRWDPYCTISGWHGVTSLVLGNCGFGFAPCKPDFRDRSMLTMTRTEAIPYASMKAGINWDWETIPQYLDSLDRSPKGINCIQYMPTASLMTYVMGLEAAKTRPATEAERAEMARILDEGMDAGLCGFSIQRLGPNSVQADFDGSPMVTDTMCDEDILNLARVLRRRDEGFMEITQGTGDAKVDLGFVEKLADESQRPILWQAIIPTRNNPEIHRRSMRFVERNRAKGRQIFGQAGTVRSGFAFTLENWNLYDTLPEWRVLTTGTKEEKLAKMQDPALRKAVIHANDNCDNNFKAIQAGVGGNPRHLILQWVENIGDSRSTSASRSARSAWKRASIRSKRCSTSRWRPISRRNSWARTVVSTPTTWPKSSTTRSSPSPAFPMAVRTPSFSPAALSRPTSCAGWCATSRRSPWKKHTIACRRCRRMRRASRTAARYAKVQLQMSSFTTSSASASSPIGSAKSCTICRAANGAGCSVQGLSLDHRERRGNV